MIRRFRAIIQTNKEPEDHEVIWKKGHKLLYWNNGWRPVYEFEASEIIYESKDTGEEIPLEEALDKILYITPKISDFKLMQAGTYETGSVITPLNFSWSYNKKLIKEQRLNEDSLDISLRSYTLDIEVTSDSTFTLWVSDGTTEVSASASISFVDYIYYGTTNKTAVISKEKINPSLNTITVTAGKGEYIWVFIPKSAGLTHIWYNNIDSTDDFERTDMKYITDTGLEIEGTYYVSKNHSLNNVTLKFT